MIKVSFHCNECGIEHIETFQTWEEAALYCLKRGDNKVITRTYPFELETGKTSTFEDTESWTN